MRPARYPSWSTRSTWPPARSTPGLTFRLNHRHCFRGMQGVMLGVALALAGRMRPGARDRESRCQGKSGREKSGAVNLHVWASEQASGVDGERTAPPLRSGERTPLHACDCTASTRRECRMVVPGAVAAYFDMNMEVVLAGSQEGLNSLSKQSTSMSQRRGNCWASHPEDRGAGNPPLVSDLTGRRCRIESMPTPNPLENCE